MATLRTGEGIPNVVVTAITSTTSLAADAEETWKLLLDGQSGIRVRDDFYVDEFELPIRIGGLLRENIDDALSRVELRRLSHLQKIGLVLSRRLWAQAGLGEDDVDTKRLMVSIGTALGTTEEAVRAYAGFLEKGLRAVSPLAVQMLMPNAPAAAIGLERKAKASIITPLTAASSGATAIVEAWRHIVLGEADVAICGGVDGWITAVPVAAFAQLDLLSSRNDDPEGAARPFDVDRDGMVFSEGGALLMLENEEHAKARGATILARVLGGSVTSDSYDDVGLDPSGDSAAEAMRRAIDHAGIQPNDIDLVVADAAGTKLGDLAEATALHQVFDGTGPAVYAPKAALGHSWGSAGAVNAVVAVQALRDQIVPATRNVASVDPAIGLDVVADAPRPGKYRYALCDAFGFSGDNVALVLGAP